MKNIAVCMLSLILSSCGLQYAHLEEYQDYTGDDYAILRIGTMNDHFIRSYHFNKEMQCLEQEYHKALDYFTPKTVVSKRVKHIEDHNIDYTKEHYINGHTDYLEFKIEPNKYYVVIRNYDEYRGFIAESKHYYDTTYAASLYAKSGQALDLVTNAPAKGWELLRKENFCK